VVVAKALGGSFKLVTLAPKTVGEMTQLPKEMNKYWQIKTTNTAKTKPEYITQ